MHWPYSPNQMARLVKELSQMHVLPRGSSVAWMGSYRRFNLIPSR